MQRYSIILFFTILYLQTGFAQQQAVDSLCRLLSKLQDDTTKIDILSDIATKYFYIQPDSTLYYAAKAEQLAIQIKDKPREIFAVNRLGGAYWIKGDLVKSLLYMKKGYEEAKIINHKSLIARNLGNIGLVYYGMGSYNLAIEFYQKSIPIFLEENNQERLAITYNNIGDAYLRLEQLDSAEFYIKKALPIAEKNKLVAFPLLLRNLGVVHFKRGNYDIGETYLKKSLSFTELRLDKINLAASYRYLAKTYYIKKDFTTATDYVLRAISAAESVHIKEQMYEAYNVYSQLLEAQNQFEKALKYRNLFVLYRDSVQSQNTQSHLQIFELEKRQGEIAQLTAERTQREAQLDRQRFVIYGFIIVLVLGSLLIGFMFKNNKKIRKINTDLNNANIAIEKQKVEILQQNRELGEQNDFIKKQSEKLVDLNYLKDRLFSIISHDLRSPLGSLKTMVSLFEDGDLSEEEFREMSPIMEKDLDYTLNLLNNLLQWAKSQMEGVHTSPEVFNIKELGNNQVGLLERLAEAKGITLENKIIGNMNVFADKNMIDLVMRNLVANAIKFCNHGDKISILGEQIGEFVHIKVQDTGIGIAPENMPKLFNKETFTTHGTTGEKGTGLGLILCKDFVERNNGDIWVESEQGKGSTFIFSVPFHANKNCDLNKSKSKHNDNLSNAA